MSAVSYKCPNCGGDLRFDPASQGYKCEYCASKFNQQELEAANPQASSDEEQSRNVSGTKPLGETAREDAGESGFDAESGALVYSCPSCGAEIVTDETTAATFCYYCHNPVVLKGKLSGEYRPDMVIPFAVDKKEAVDSFLQYVRSKKFVPKDFFCKEQIEKISGVYFPFWMYSCKAKGMWQGTGDMIRVYRMGDMEYTETKVFDVERRADFSFRQLMRNALNKENRQLVESVQPFLTESAKEFSMGYLSGFLAEKRDIEQKDVIGELEQEIKQHADGMMRASVSGYMAVRDASESVRIQEAQWKYLLLPVWVLTYRGSNGKLYYYAMNGQTKKVCGVLPLDKGRMAALFFSVFAPLFLLLLAGGYFLW
ncbi:MAG: TFIIB-type zinc ribbon-containing protein [Eubacteriales bacterium]|nr:TFIIB-type zinc ribbon-containing protein [Eubacteriales bacterium]